MAHAKEKWIQKAIKRPGGLTAKAKRSGGYSAKTGKIKESWLNKAVKKSGVLGKEARLAKTLKKLRKKYK